VYLNTVLISRDGYAAVPHIGHEKEGPIPGFTDNGKLYQSIPSSCDLNRANSSFDLSCRLSEIWTSDILPQFDMFWDYKNARPKDFQMYKRTIQSKYKKSKPLVACCCSKNKKNKMKEDKNAELDRIKNQQSRLLVWNLWKLGLPHSVRSTLWSIVIANKLSIWPKL